MKPSPPLTVRTSPLGATARPSGKFRLPRWERVVPVPAEVVRSMALGITAIRLLSVSATYSARLLLPTAVVQSSGSLALHAGLRPTPVGPITSAAGSVRSEKPEPITVIDSIDG